MLFRLGRSCLSRALLGLALLGSTIPFQAYCQEAPPSAAPSAQTLDASLDQARDLIKTGEYDNAIEILKVAIEQARNRFDALREAHLLLAKTYWIQGNDYRVKPQGRAASDLSYQEAKRVIAECLRTKELRHTYPVPASEYPREMIAAFAEVRGEIFGSFRVAELEPPGAVVLLDADTLRIQPGETVLGDVDLAVGPHVVVVRAAGYKNLTEEISISPNSTLERPYRLAKRRSGTWYATVATGAVGVVAGVVALVSGKGGATTTLEPLPGAPPPPAGP